MRIVLVTRAGCHLCEDALSLLRERGMQPELADVDADAELFRLYDWRVPVVLLEGAVAVEGHITGDRLDRALNRSGGEFSPA